MTGAWPRLAGVLAGFLLALVLAALPAGAFGQAQGVRVLLTAGDVVFEQSPSGTNHYLIMDLHNGTLVNLSTGSGPFYTDYNPDVSPNGSRIAFTGDRPNADSPNTDGESLVVMNSDGSGQTVILPSRASPFTEYLWPVWSPDGSKIVLIKGTAGASNIATVNPDGTGYRALTTGGVDYFPTWSPDGSKIAYENDSGSAGGQIYMMNSNGSNQHLVAGFDSGFIDVQPVWSPDGKRIYFLSSRGTPGIYYYTSKDNWATTTGISVHRLGGPFENTGAQTLKISADGSMLTYSRPDDTSGCFQIYTISTSTAATTQLTNTGCKDQNFAPTFVGATWPNASTKTVVGLGDSVAAGEGINYGFVWKNGKWVQIGPSNPSWMDTSRALGANYSGCHQSGKGYPAFLSLDGGNYDVYNMACTGASALQNNGLENGGVLDREILSDGTSPPAQLGGTCTGCDPPSAVFDSHSPDIVTLTVGADDINFAHWVRTCYLSVHACNSTANTNTLHSQLSREKTDLATVFSQLNDWATSKNKKLLVLVTNYYNPFNPNLTNCIDYNPALGFGLTGSELSWLENGLTDLNANIAADVKQAQTSDTSLKVSLVDLSGVMAGHEFCTSSPWVYGPSIDLTSAGNPAPFHPTPEGQRKIYMAVKAHLP
jgi:Tol biopolymer transport system component